MASLTADNMASNFENITIGVFKKDGENSLDNLYEYLDRNDLQILEDIDNVPQQPYPNDHESIKMDILRKNPPKYWVTTNPVQAKFVKRTTMQLKLKENVQLDPYFGVAGEVPATEIINWIGLADVDGGFCEWWGRTGGMPFRIIKDPRDSKFKLLWDYETIIKKREDIEGFMWEERDPPPDTATIPMELIYSRDGFPIGVKYGRLNGVPDIQYFYAFGERFTPAAVSAHLAQCPNISAGEKGTGGRRRKKKRTKKKTRRKRRKKRKRRKRTRRKRRKRKTRIKK